VSFYFDVALQPIAIIFVGALCVSGQNRTAVATAGGQFFFLFLQQGKLGLASFFLG
jgi:hypothetical protein